MPGEQDNKQILVKAADLLHHLVTADRRHQKVQKQNVIMSVTHPLYGLIRIVFRVHMIAGTLKICLQRQRHGRVVIQSQNRIAADDVRYLLMLSHCLLPPLSLDWATETAHSGIDMPKIAPPPGLSSTHMLPPNFPRTTVLEIYSPSPVPIVHLLVIISLYSRFFTCGFTPGPVSFT